MTVELVHTHVHSDRSILDSIIKIPELVARCKELGMKAVAVTDHGLMASAIRLYEECKKQEIKPLIGCEIYISPTDDHTLKEKIEDVPAQQNYHLVLLAINAEGVKQLYKLSSIGFLEGFYYKPRVSLKLIEEIGKDLIVTSACIKGPVAWNLAEGHREVAEKWLGRLKESFKGRFWLEFMDHGMEVQKRVNVLQEELSKKFDVPWIPTNDAHFLRREDHYIHNIMMALQHGQTLETLSMNYSEETYFKSPEEMASLFGEEACRRTLDVEAMVDIQLELDVPHFPAYSEE
jgi:DNA polymerase-3 subunit alpha